jgi:acyl-CoA thioesterase-1
MGVIGRLAIPLLLLALSGCGQVAQRTAASHPTPVARPTVRLLFVGASVTAGYGALDPAHAYPELVVSRLQAAGWNMVVHVVAHPGATAGEARGWPLNLPSDAIVVHLVTNDYARDTPLLDYRAEYADLIGRLRASSPRARLVCLGGWDSPSAFNRLGVPARSYNEVAREVCEQAAGTFVDISGLYLQSDDHGPAGTATALGLRDTFHPNDLGHRKLAAAVLKALGMPAAASGSRTTV